MAGKSNIEWTEQTWNPIVGCSIVSPGCTNCYAMKMAARIIAMAGTSKTGLHYDKTIKDVKGNPVWTAVVNLAPEHILLAPLRRKKPTTYFVNSMGDLFHEHAPDEWIDKVFAVMALCPQHTFQVLTKRAERMRAYVSARPQAIWDRCALEIDPTALDRLKAIGWPLPNTWLGVSAERQQEADERIPLLLQTPAAVRFVSAEPLLGPISLGALRLETDRPWDALRGRRVEPDDIDIACPKLDWIIVGGESGHGARPMHIGWVRDIEEQCAAANVAFFFKQWGEWKPGYYGDGIAPHCIAINGAISSGDKLEGGGHRPRWMPITRVGKKAAGRLLDGIEHSAMPKVTA